MVIGKLKTMTLDELNGELDFIGASRTYSDVKAARVAVAKFIMRGEILASEEVMDEAATIAPTKNDEKTPEKVAPKGGTKKEKAPKEPPKRNWNQEFAYQGRRVYTALGVGHLIAEDKGNKRFLVEIDGKKRDVAESSIRFKALDDKYRDRYFVDREAKTASGAASISIGDDVANGLKSLDLPSLGHVANENGLSEKWDKWKNLNPGMRRMNLGNMLRNKAKKGEKVTILGKTPEEAAKIREAEIAAEVKKAKAAKAAKAKAAAETKKTPAKAAKK